MLCWRKLYWKPTTRKVAVIRCLVRLKRRIKRGEREGERKSRISTTFIEFSKQFCVMNAVGDSDKTLLFLYISLPHYFRKQKFHTFLVGKKVANNIMTQLRQTFEKWQFLKEKQVSETKKRKVANEEEEKSFKLSGEKAKNVECH